MTELPIQPMVLLFEGFPATPAICSLNLFTSFVYLICGTLYIKHTRKVLTPFIPNEYMFEKFKDKGAERAHVYAWVLREAMSKATGMPTDDKLDLLNKSEYQVKVRMMKKSTLDKIKKKAL